MTAVIVSSRRNVAPFGLAGGADAAPGRQWVERAGGAIETLTGTDSAGRAQTLSYALSLDMVDGEWEVDQFGGAPALAPAP